MSNMEEKEAIDVLRWAHDKGYLTFTTGKDEIRVRLPHVPLPDPRHEVQIASREKDPDERRRVDAEIAFTPFAAKPSKVKEALETVGVKDVEIQDNVEAIDRDEPEAATDPRATELVTPLLAIHGAERVKAALGIGAAVA